MRLRLAVTIVLASLCATRVARGQQDSSKNSPGTPIHVGTIERPALPHEDNPNPRYPDSLRASGLSGVVLVEFTVTTNGRVDSRTVHIVESPDSLFTRAVLEVLPSLRFYPAEIGGSLPTDCVAQSNGPPLCRKPGGHGKKVAMHLQMPFRFVAPSG